jgi:streptogramin lyase/predicted Ser/Thr protein kinase
MPGTIATGSVLGGYRILSLISRGGMGEVYLAEDQRLGRHVALKLPASELAADEGFRDRFLRETRLAASLEHPAMVPIYEAGEDDGRLFMAMRYVEGEDLGSLLRRERHLGLQRALKILSPIADCLDATHDLGLVHRDVKPGNILVGLSDRAYLTDFGLTKRRGSTSALTRTGQLVGTLDYVAPEQVEGREVDGRADQYSLACVAFEMLAGRPPFIRPNDAALLYAHVHADRPRISDHAAVPSAVDAPIARAMAKAPSERFDTCVEFLHALEVGAGARDVPAVPSTRRRGGRIAVSTTIVGVLLVLGVLVAIIVGGSDRRPGDGTRSEGRGPANGALVRIDPTSGELTRTVEGLPPHLPSPGRRGFSFDLVVGEGGVWDERGSSILHVDPENGELVEEIASPGFGIEMDVGHRTLWVIIIGGANVQRFNPATDDALRTLRLPTSAHPSTSNGATDVAVDRRAVWVSTFAGEIMRLDPGTQEIDPTTLVRSLDRLVAADGWVYAIDRLSSTGLVWRANADPSDADEVDLGTVNVEEAAAGEDRVWLLDATVGAVVSVDPASQALETIPIGPGATDIDVGLGYVWVSSQSGILYRIDPTTLVATPIDVGAPLIQVATDDDGDAVWVSVFDLADPG